MAEAIIAGMFDGSMDVDIAVVEPIEARRDELSSRYGVEVSPNCLGFIEGSAVLIFAVKPQQFPAAAAQVALELGQQTVVSIMAGIPIARIRSALNHDAVARVMPNTPSQIGRGATAWTATDAVPASSKRLIGNILDCIGVSVYFEDEKLVDVATALSASGPAYVYVFIEALIDVAVQLGMSAPDAKRLAIAMVQGSAELAAVRDVHPAELRNSVTSPGGTTAAALKVLESGKFRNTTMEAVLAAHQRGIELSDQT